MNEYMNKWMNKYMNMPLNDLASLTFYTYKDFYLAAEENPMDCIWNYNIGIFFCFNYCGLKQNTFLVSDAQLIQY